MADHTSGWPSVAELCIIFKLLLRTLSLVCVSLSEMYYPINLGQLFHWFTLLK
jgi:hypothetical protein